MKSSLRTQELVMLKQRKSVVNNRTLLIADLKERTLEDVLQEVVREREVLTVCLPQGEMVTIKPSPLLKKLPELEGFVPKGWKDAIYE